MFNPPTDYVWRQKVKIYEEKFCCDVPQWIQTFDLIHSTRILSIAININWRLPDAVLTAGEPFSGFGGLWFNRWNKWDVVISNVRDKK